MNLRILIPIAAVALVVGGSALLTCRKPREGSTLEISGNIEVTQVEASFRIGGRVLERPVEEGQAVQAGQVLARLESEELRQTVAMRRADQAVAQAALAALEAGSRREDIDASRAGLEQAAAELRRLEPDEARLRDLRDRGIVSKRDYEAVLASLEVARARVRQADRQYALVSRGPRVEEIAQGRARLEQARQALALTETQLGHATLTSPIAGIVLSKNVEADEFVSPGTSVVTLGDLRRVWLRGYVDETDLGRVKVGQKAILRTDSFPEKTYEGRVSFISAEAEFTPKSIQTQKERVKLVYRIKIEVPNPDMELKPGMPADAEIRVEGP